MAANEFDVIESFVRSNARFVDAIVVLDHASVDGTGAILAQLAREGLPLVVLEDRDAGFRQAHRQTYLAKRYMAEMSADFCFPLDADEFLRCESRASLEEALAALEPGVFGLLPMQNYFGAGPDRGALDPLRRFTRRMRDERAVSRKVALRREFAGFDDALISFGNHAALRMVEGRAQPFPHRPLEGVSLAHFPVRSPEQIAKKALIGWLSWRLTQPGEPAPKPEVRSANWHWHQIFSRIVAGEEVIDERLMQQAIGICAGGQSTDPVRDAELVEDPLDPPYELRYTPSAPHRPLAVLAAWAERLVSEVNAAAAKAR